MLIWVLFVLFGVSLVINVALIRPESVTEWLRAVYTAPGTFGVLVLVLGATPLWRWVWSICPRLANWVYPDLNGIWITNMESNFATLAKYHPDFADTDISKIPSAIPGKFQIKQNWFKFHIRFDGDDNYSSSDTLIVEPRRDQQSGSFFLTYIYKNKTIAPKDTDEQFHLGAADLEIGENFHEMRGPYWTNRNASKGLNTAGTLVAKREANPVS